MKVYAYLFVSYCAISLIGGCVLVVGAAATGLA